MTEKKAGTGGGPETGNEKAIENIIPLELEVVKSRLRAITCSIQKERFFDSIILRSRECLLKLDHLDREIERFRIRYPNHSPLWGTHIFQKSELFNAVCLLRSILEISTFQSNDSQAYFEGCDYILSGNSARANLNELSFIESWIIKYDHAMRSNLQSILNLSSNFDVPPPTRDKIPWNRGIDTLKRFHALLIKYGFIAYITLERFEAFFNVPGEETGIPEGRIRWTDALADFVCLFDELSKRPRCAVPESCDSVAGPLFENKRGNELNIKSITQTRSQIENGAKSPARKIDIESLIIELFKHQP